jgi:hypothetical protein
MCVCVNRDGYSYVYKYCVLFLEKRKARGSKYFFLFFYRGQVFSLAMTDGPHLLALPVIYIMEKEGTDGLWAGGWGEPSAPWGPRASSSPPASRPLHAFVRSGFQFPRIFTCFGSGARPQSRPCWSRIRVQPSDCPWAELTAGAKAQNMFRCFGDAKRWAQSLSLVLVLQ